MADDNEQPLPPSTHGSDRAPGGKFAKGNRLGKGNPLAGRAAKIRAVLLKALTPKAAQLIADKLIEHAIAGDLASIRELLDRTIGKAAPTELIERLEAIEEKLNQGLP